MSVSKIKLPILFAATILCTSCYAQDSLRTGFEFGVNAFNLTMASIPAVNGSGDNYQPNYLNGVFFKLHYPAFSLRVSADHFSQVKKITAKGAEQDTLTSSNRYTNTLVSAGVERTSRRLSKKFFQVFYGADLSMFTGEFNSTNVSVSTLTNFTSHKSQTGVGVNPFAGFRFLLGKVFVLSYEASVNAIFYKENETRIYITPMVEEQNTTSLNFMTRPNLVNRLSVSFFIPAFKQAKKV